MGEGRKAGYLPTTDKHPNSQEKQFWPFNPLTPRSICNSPYCQPYNSYNVSSDNLVLDQLIIPKLIDFFILITCLLDIVWILKGEILS